VSGRVDAYPLPYQLANLASAVTFARLRCLPLAELVTRATDVSHPEHQGAVRVLRERKLRAGDARLLACGLRKAIQDQYRAALPQQLRGRSDRLLGNLAPSLPPRVARSFALELVQHRLSARRKAAVSVLRRVGVKPADAEALKAAVHNFGDVWALELLTRIPGALADWNCCSLLSLSSEAADWDPSYRSSLVIARLWSDGMLDHDHAVAEHAVAYVRALGRTRDGSRISLVLDCVKRSSDPDLLQLAASVAGRGGHVDLLDSLEKRLDELGS
jgi:hypothetical protein